MKEKNKLLGENGFLCLYLETDTTLQTWHRRTCKPIAKEFRCAGLSTNDERILPKTDEELMMVKLPWESQERRRRHVRDGGASEQFDGWGVECGSPKDAPSVRLHHVPCNFWQFLDAICGICFFRTIARREEEEELIDDVVCTWSSLFWESPGW